LWTASHARDLTITAGNWNRMLLGSMIPFLYILTFVDCFPCMMMTANVVNLTIPVFVNDSCNSLIMMVVIITKMFFPYGFNMSTDC
jgi:hypothetical protein